ncbi:MAG TPA: amino acid adenylation domain-containing protein [Pyrinomonadaceae bacterium]|nr:amino acid adenylation domain-containing protein [Pyrinomonadaceae bacterium]
MLSTTTIPMYDRQADEALAYWRGELERVPAPTRLPLAAPAVATDARHDAAKVVSAEVSLPPDLLGILATVTRGSERLAFVTVSAAAVACFVRYTGERGVRVGFRPGASEIFPLVIENAAASTFRALLETLRQKLRDAATHARVSAERLAKEIAPEQIFDIVLSSVREGGDASAHDDHSGHSLELEIDTAGECVLRARFSAARYETGDIERLLRHVVAALRSGLGRPATNVGALSYVSADERAWLLSNGRGASREIEGTLVERIERAAALDGARVAVAAAAGASGARYTYAELKRRSDALARHLRALGVGAETRVAICLGRTPDFITAALAVWKAGGAYVPLDPEQPAARLSAMIEDAGTAVVLTCEALRERLPAHWGVEVSLDGAEAEHIWNERDAPFESTTAADTSTPAAAADALAYVLYTSGSTGKPKGVMVTHGGLLNYLEWATETYGVAACTGALVHTSVGFDLTLTGLLTPLLCGRTVTLIDETDAASAITRAVEPGEGASLLKLTPAHLELVENCLAPERAAAFAKILVIGGEALTGDKLEFWQRHAPETRLINEYGPTETVVGCCVYEVPAGEAIGGAVAIGRPIANTELYVVDACGELCPVGVPGELYIGGAGVARGYLNRPELTAEKFIPDSFSTKPGARLYRTGDVARWRADGQLEFLGRRDEQVKLRGYRIELGEIEATLAGHGGVRGCAVMLREVAGTPALVAYVTGEAEADELKDYLARQLPSYMLPQHIVRLEALPLTANGKVDRKALPAPEAERCDRYVAPRTAVEEILCAMWAELLMRERVGVEDNFFALGGHSLLAAQVVSRIRATLGLDVSLRVLFERLTVAALAEELEQQMRESEPETIIGDLSEYVSAHASAQLDACLVPLSQQASGVALPLFCVHPASGLAHLYVELAANLPERPFYGLQSHGLSPARALDTTVEAMAERYLSEVMRREATGPYFLAGWSLGGKVAFEMARQLERAGRPVGLVAIFDTAPELPPVLEIHSELTWEEDYLTRSGATLGLDADELLALDKETRIKRYLDAAQAAGHVPAEVSREQFARFLEVYATNEAASRAYRPQGYAGRVVLFRSSAEHEDLNDSYGWERYALGGVEVVRLAATHGQFVQGTSAHALADAMRPFLHPGARSHAGRK